LLKNNIVQFIAGGRDRGEATEMGQMLEDTVFIQGLPETVTEELLAKHFSSVGAVKVCFLLCIWYN